MIDNFMLRLVSPWLSGPCLELDHKTSQRCMHARCDYCTVSADVSQQRNLLGPASDHHSVVAA
jgi:hypothetical protein